MKLLQSLLFILLVASAVSLPVNEGPKFRADKSSRHGTDFVCYFTNWSQYRPGVGKYTPNDVDPYLCTNIIYAFIEINTNNELSLREWNGDKLIAELTALRYSNPDLKVTAAVGGWNFGSERFTAMVATEQTMNHFVSTAVAFLRSYGFDGLDLDWEYPANRGSPPEDKQRFTVLCQKLMDAFVNEAASTGNERMMLTVAVAAGYETLTTAYEIPEICRILDKVHLMAYDLHGGSWEDITNHNSPLLPGDVIYNDVRDAFTVDNATTFWLDGGCPPDKLVLGIPSYGRTFTLEDKSSYGYGAQAAADSAGSPGTYTREEGFLSYYEICPLINGGIVLESNNAKAPAVVSGDQWIGYDDETSVRTKVAYMKSRGLGGIMVWSLDLDDFTGLCASGVKNPLMRTMKDELHDGAVNTNPCYPQATTTVTTWWPPAETPTEAPPNFVCFYDDSTCDCSGASTPSTTKSPSTQPSSSTIASTTVNTDGGGDFTCNGDGYYQEECNCQCYYNCHNGAAYYQCCADGLLWDQSNAMCNWANEVSCDTCESTTTTAATTIIITASSTTSAAPITTTVAQANFCEGKQDGNYADPDDKTIFHQCAGGKDTVHHCAEGLIFDGNICNWP